MISLKFQLFLGNRAAVELLLRCTSAVLKYVWVVQRNQPRGIKTEKWTQPQHSSPDVMPESNNNNLSYTPFPTLFFLPRTSPQTFVQTFSLVVKYFTLQAMPVCFSEYFMQTTDSRQDCRSPPAQLWTANARCGLTSRSSNSQYCRSQEVDIVLTQAYVLL